MKVGIIVFSQTGHTRTVAERLAAALGAKGHAVAIAQVEPAESVKNASAPVKLKTAPDVAAYDALVFASPVQGFTLARTMQAYMNALPSLSGKKVACFVTQQLKRPWLGGNRAVRMLRSACAEKGADVGKSAIVHWSSKEREAQIAQLVEELREIR